MLLPPAMPARLIARLLQKRELSVGTEEMAAEKQRGAKMETLITVVIVLIVLGLAMYLVNSFLPMDGRIKMIINAVLVLLAIIYLLNIAGLLGGSATLD
jgi:membrane glycosyltransferase